MRTSIHKVALILLSLGLGWAVFFKGGVWPDQWSVSLACIGVAACLFWLFSRSDSSQRCVSGKWLNGLLLAFPTYIALTLVPLPLGALKIVSPTRAALLTQIRTVAPGVGFAPLSVDPPATVLHLFSTIAYIAVFLLLRQLVFSFRRRFWIPAIPLLLFATFEAGLGVFQAWAGAQRGIATGTYNNRDHFSGLLEMILPLAVLYGFELWGNGGLRRPQSLVLACASWTAGALMFLAILWSSSRMGLIVGLFVLLLAIASALSDKSFSSRGHRWAMGAGASAAILIATVLLFPDQLAGRFAALSAGEHVTTEIRTSLWKETLPLLSEYRLFGCGLGGFESVFSRHQSVSNAYVVEFAHNDYLQYLAELGILGFALGAGAIALLGSKVLRGLSSERKLENRKLLSACAIGLAGLALHSFVDFNTYIPANAMTMAWLAGMAAAIVQE